MHIIHIIYNSFILVMYFVYRMLYMLFMYMPMLHMYRMLFYKMSIKHSFHMCIMHFLRSIYLMYYMYIIKNMIFV